MATARSIIQDAYLEIGVLAEGEPMGAALAQFGLLRLQNQIDSWGADRLTIAVSPRVPFTLPNGTSTLTIGPGGDINTSRPLWFTAINYISPGSSPAVETPLGQMDDASFAALSIKSLTSSLPQEFYYTPEAESDRTLGALFFWPTVTQNVSLAAYFPAAVGIPATLDAPMVGRAGYQEAFMYQLAMRLARPLGRPITDDLRQDAANAYATMTRPNNIPAILGVDAALAPTAGGAYNIYSDSSTGSSST